MNPTKLRHLVPLQAGIQVAVGYCSSLLHLALLLELKSYRMTNLLLDGGPVCDCNSDYFWWRGLGGGGGCQLPYEKVADDCQKI